MSSLTRRPGFILALGLCVIGGAVTLLGRLAVGPQTAPTRVQLNNVAGTEACPSFAPNGRHLAYSGRGADAAEPFHVWVRALPTGAPQQLTNGTASDICPVYSPDGGSVAFLRTTDDGGQYVVMPAAGGAEKVLAQTAISEDSPAIHPSVAWSHDGKSLLVAKLEEGSPSAIYEIPVAGGAARRLTNPPAGSAGDSSPALSPDGQTLAFVRSGREGGDDDVWLTDRNGGGLRQLTFDRGRTRGIAWTPDGHDLIYASNRVRGWKLWRITAFGGSPREVMIGASVANDPAIAAAGHRLAYTQTPSMSAIWLANLPAGDTPHTLPIIRSSGREAYPSWSPDGKRIAWISDRSGNDEVWVSDASGGNPQQVTDMKAPGLARPRWFADNRTLLFATRGMPQSVYTIDASSRMAQGKAQPLMPGVVLNDLSPSRDGKSDYYDFQGAIWKYTKGAGPKRLTERGGLAPEESPDGKYVYYLWRGSIWRIPPDGGKEEEVTQLSQQWVSYLQPVAKGLYFMGWERRRRMGIVYYDFATQQTSDVLHMNDAEISRDADFDVSPDGKYLLYPKIDRAQTDLVVVENFR